MNSGQEPIPNFICLQRVEPNRPLALGITGSEPNRNITGSFPSLADRCDLSALRLQSKQHTSSCTSPVFRFAGNTHAHSRGLFNLFHYLHVPLSPNSQHNVWSELTSHKAAVTTTIRLRRFDCNSTALRPFDDLSHERAAAL